MTKEINNMNIKDNKQINDSIIIYVIVPFLK